MKHLTEDIKDEKHDERKYRRRAKEYPHESKEFHRLSREEAGHAKTIKRIRAIEKSRK